jgi:hypothetical protein
MRTGQVLLVRDGRRGAGRVAEVVEAEVVEVLGVNAGPPFVVRWLDTGRTSVVYPDGDVWTERVPHPAPREPHGNRCG